MSADASRLLVRLDDPPIHLESMGEEHREPLRAACAQDQEIWPLYMESFAPEHFDQSFDRYMANPKRLILASFSGGVLVGMTSYLNVETEHELLEIGGTYLAPPARGTDVNGRIKQLMIDHAIACGFQRIEFRIDARNARSQRAVEKLGAVREGLMRRHRITWTGHLRDTVLYSLLAEDWASRALRRP